MRSLPEQLELRLAERSRRGQVTRDHALPAAIEQLHELQSAFIVDPPQAHQHRARAGRQEPAHQTDQLVTGPDGVQPGFTSAEGHQVGTEPKPVDVADGEPAIMEPQPRPERALGTEVGVGRQMDETGFAHRGGRSIRRHRRGLRQLGDSRTARSDGGAPERHFCLDRNWVVISLLIGGGPEPSPTIDRNASI